MSNKYSPVSHFYVDQTNLSNASSSDFGTDAFGPIVNQGLSSQFRTTAKVRATTLTKVFAICKGRILVQPMTGDDTKVNLILKPETTYNPLKIKYFIYRGINKADLIINDSSLAFKSLTNPNQPLFLQNLWDNFNTLNTSIPNNPAPTVFPPFEIGYFPTDQTPETLIEDCFISRDSSYQIPICNAGEYIGNFTGQLGLDIVLDYGDYKLEKQQELFKLDLAFARKSDNIFDVGQFSAPNQLTNKRRYQEHIHQFLDAAAFWGSHIICGTIKLPNNSADINSNTDIVNIILNKYQTKNKIYTYIQGEHGRSYNYYDSNRTIIGINSSGGLNNNNGWPILIEEISETITIPNNVKVVQITLQYNFNANIDQTQRHISIDVISPNNNTNGYPFAQNLLDVPPVPPNTVKPPNGRTAPISITFQTNGLKSCATFLMIYANLTQNFPLSNYYDDLWPANLIGNFSLPASSPNLSYWATYDKNRMLNLNPRLGIGAAVQNKIVFDTGANAANITTPTKQRRLFMAILKRNTNHSLEFEKLNIDTVTSGISKKQSSVEEYNLNLYNDQNYSVYKGQVKDNQDIITSLSLIHATDFEKKNSYFHLGITDDEYQSISQTLPSSVDNVYFDLREVLDNNNIPIAVTTDFKKFKVGLKYEDSAGMIVSTLDSINPIPLNIYVYTLDGYYFFSKDYSDYQVFYNQFAKAKVEFRTKIADAIANPPVIAYTGEFGFDWIRDGDNGEPTYQSTIINGYETPSIHDLNTQYENKDEAFKALKDEYKSIPTQKSDSQYYVPYLGLYSQTYSNSVNISPKPAFDAELRVFVEIDEPLNKLEFDYDATIFTIDKPILSDKQVTSKGLSIDKTIKITCNQDFNVNKQIRILAYPVGVTNKKDAKLAGIILLSRNDTLSRKELKFVLVKVQTNVTGVFGALEIGDFSLDEKTNLFKALHQALISIETIEEILPLETDPNFTIGGLYVINGQWIDYNKVGLYQNLQNKLIAINGKYANYFKIFAFDVPTQPDSNNNSVVGRVQDIGIHSVILYKGRGFITLSHESLHGLGLRHTHSDGGIIDDVKQKYIYPNALSNPADATDNYMSYNADRRKSIWYWQSRIIYYFLH
jgi:hypothetical protein